jgi:SH3 domain protein
VELYANKNKSVLKYLRKSVFWMAYLIFFIASAAQADNRWVTDDFEVMLRTGKSTKQSIVRQLGSGTRVEFLKEDAESGYTQVRLPSGTEGWVLTRYLQRSPTAALQLPELQKRLSKNEEQRTAQRQEIAELKKERQRLQNQLQELQSNSSSTQQQLERITKLSADTIQVDDQNRQLKQRLADSERQIDLLTAENNSLASRSDREWFLVGGAVLAVGLLLGLILPRINWSKKSSWNDF